MEESQDLHGVQELGLLAYLLLQGLRPVKTVPGLTGRKIEFYFPKKEAVAAEERYFSGAMVEARAYSNALRDAKTLVMQAMKRHAAMEATSDGRARRETHEEESQ